MTIIQIGAAGATVILLVALGCHSTPLKNQTSGTSAAVQSSWVKDYKEARAKQASDPATSCRIFTALASEPKFPAREMASLRRVEVCPDQQGFSLDRAQLPTWMQEIALNISLRQAAKSGDPAAELELALEKSRQNLPQSEKVKWAQLAIQRAEELKLQDRVDEMNTRLYQIAPRLNPQPKVRDFLEVASDYRMARQFEKSREYYRKVIESSHFRLEEKISAWKGIRLGYKNARQMEQHIQACFDLVQYLRRLGKVDSRSRLVRQASYDAEIYWGRAVWTAHRASEARKIFADLEKRMRGKVSLAELHWLQARMSEEERDYDSVSRFLQMALKERIQNADLRDKILWYGAWNERRRENLPLAAQLLAELEAKTPQEFTRVRAQFWLGKTYQELKQDESAKEVFERLVALDPLGYYGLLAHRNLEKEISLKIGGAQELHVDTNIPLDITMAEWLAMIEEKDALNSLLDLASQAYKKQAEQTNDGWVTLFQFYAKGGLYMRLYEALGSLPPERRKSILESQPALLFPQPWQNEVKTAALQFGVEEELLYAIMRQESAFDTRARSIADAFGLMQVLPEVAETIGLQNKIPYAGMEDLYHPQTNVQIGAAHIRELLQRNRNQFILAVASYNASEKAIRNWMKTRFRGDSLEFIEEIPYEETRTYVRLVMRNMIFYSLLKSKSASIEFPNWVLKLEDAS